MTGSPVHVRYRVSAAGVQHEPNRIEPIRSWPLPLGTRTEVRKLLGLASLYRNFISGFAKIAVPLTDLLKKDRQLVWADGEDKPAKTLIEHLAPVLAKPDFDKHVLPNFDASDAAVGVMLSKHADESKTHRIIARHSCAVQCARGALCGLMGR